MSDAGDAAPNGLAAHRWLVPLAASALAVAQLARVWPWMLDDAFIYLRYAQNWVEGHGPNYNVGERCEGYSSFLWIALLAAGHALGGDLVVLARAASIVPALIAFVLVQQAWRWIPGLSRNTAAMAAMLLAGHAAFVPWAISGMETALLAALVTALILAWCRFRASPSRARAWGLGLLAAATAMTRPEGVILVLLLALDGTTRLRRAGWRSPFALWAAVVGAVLLPWTALRLAYYGWLMPNTYYAKVAFTLEVYERGLVYLAEWLVPAAALLLCHGLAAWRGALSRAGLAGHGVLLLVWLGYVVLVGGDFMPAFRFLAPLVPLLCLGAALGIATLRAAAVRRLAFGAVFVAGLAAGELSPRLVRYLQDDEVAQAGLVIGRFLREHSRPGDVIAVNAAGAIPFAAQRTAIDMLGLNDEHIAHRPVPGMGRAWAGHEKGDGKYVLARRPQWILFGSIGEDRSPRYLSNRELLELEEFHRRYALEAHPIDAGTRFPMTTLWVYRRKDPR